MHYIPGTPWYDAVGAELELELAAGNVGAVTPSERSGKTFRPVLALAWILGVEFVLASVFAWIN